MILTATPSSKVSVYYCKAGIKTGLVVRAEQDGRRWECRGVNLTDANANMEFDNATGRAKRSGARCILIVTAGIVQLKDASPIA